MILHIIDDDHLVHRFYEVLLKPVLDDPSLESFYNGKDALDFLNQNKDDREILPDVILLDINMPIMDGWTFLENFENIVWKMTKRPSIFVVTSCLINPKDLRESTHVKGYFSKPLADQDLMQIVGTNASIV